MYTNCVDKVKEVREIEESLTRKDGAGLAMAGRDRPSLVTVPNLLCSNLNGQARVATLMFRDSAHGGSKAEGALALMKSIARQRQKAAQMGCPVPKGI